MGWRAWCRRGWIVVACLLPSGAALAAAATEAPVRRVGATLYGWVVPEEPDFLMGVGSVDRDWLHVEGRYNYESLRTGAIFAGVNGRRGERVHLEATAMLGGLFGDVDGVAPALRFVAAAWKLDLSVEAEYVVVVGHLADSFFYCWSELGLSPWRWLRVGLVAQRTRVLQNELDVQRGVLASATAFGSITVAAYVLNLGSIAPTYVGAIGATF